MYSTHINPPSASSPSFVFKGTTTTATTKHTTNFTNTAPRIPDIANAESGKFFDLKVEAAGFIEIPSSSHHPVFARETLSFASFVELAPEGTVLQMQNDHSLQSRGCVIMMDATAWYRFLASGRINLNHQVALTTTTMWGIYPHNSSQ